MRGLRKVHKSAGDNQRTVEPVVSPNFLPMSLFIHVASLESLPELIAGTTRGMVGGMGCWFLEVFGVGRDFEK